MYLISPLYIHHSKHCICPSRCVRMFVYMALFCDNLLLVLPHLPFTHMLVSTIAHFSLPHTSLCSPSVPPPPPPLSSLLLTSCNTWMVGTPTSLLLAPRKDLLHDSILKMLAIPSTSTLTADATDGYSFPLHITATDLRPDLVW